MDSEQFGVNPLIDSGQTVEQMKPNIIETINVLEGDEKIVNEEPKDIVGLEDKVRQNLKKLAYEDWDLLETAMRHYVSPLYVPTLDAIRSRLAFHKVYMSLSTRLVFDGQACATFGVVIVGALNPNTHQRTAQPYLLLMTKLEDNSGPHLFDEAIQLLWPLSPEGKAKQRLAVCLVSEELQNEYGQVISDAYEELVSALDSGQLVAEEFGPVKLDQCFPELNKLLGAYTGDHSVARSVIPLEHVSEYSVVYCNAQLLTTIDVTGLDQ